MVQRVVTFALNG